MKDIPMLSEEKHQVRIKRYIQYTTTLHFCIYILRARIFTRENVGNKKYPRKKRGATVGHLVFKLGDYSIYG